jgi:hypothetical protein
MSGWLELTANKLKQSYVTGFLDISGGGLYLRNDLSINIYDNTGSNIPRFSIKSDSMRITDTIGDRYDLSTSQLLYLKDVSQNIQTQFGDLALNTKYISNDISNIDTLLELDGTNKNIKVYGNILPSNGYTYDLGSSSLPFDSLYLGNIYNSNVLTVGGNLNANYGITVSGDTTMYGNNSITATTECTNINTGALVVSGGVGIKGNCIAGSVSTSSDYRIKENIQTLGETFVVDNLRPVQYYNKTTNTQDIGFVAHEVQVVYPYLVKGEKDGKDIQSLNYIGLIGILVKEIQCLKQKLSNIEKKIN